MASVLTLDLWHVQNAKPGSTVQSVDKNVKSAKPGVIVIRSWTHDFVQNVRRANIKNQRRGHPVCRVFLENTVTNKGVDLAKYAKKKKRALIPLQQPVNRALTVGNRIPVVHVVLDVSLAKQEAMVHVNRAVSVSTVQVKTGTAHFPVVFFVLFAQPGGRLPTMVPQNVKNAKPENILKTLATFV
jgi:hypothetical protein